MRHLVARVLGAALAALATACTCESGAPCDTAISELGHDDAAALCDWMYATANLGREHQCERWCVAVGTRDSWRDACIAGFSACGSAAAVDGCTTEDVEQCYAAHRGDPCALAAAADCDGLSFCCDQAFMLDFWGSSRPPTCGQSP
jgi:hypothetical protein